MLYLNQTNLGRNIPTIWIAVRIVAGIRLLLKISDEDYLQSFLELKMLFNELLLDF